MNTSEENHRAAGVLLHPTSLPNENDGLGVLDHNAWKFVDWMQAAGLSIWQMLPLTEPHADLSPYQSVSAFAMNPALLPLDWQASLDEAEFAKFLADKPSWLADYALFMAIKKVENGKCWAEWPKSLKFREAKALQAFSKQHASLITELYKEQYMLLKLWSELKDYANQKAIKLFGDMPIFVAYDSVDVWVNPQEFVLDENLQPSVVTGVPPDYFSETGQRWGNPHYDWQVMQTNDFSWWKARIGETLKQFDLVRIDHFRGLQAVWEIDAEEETAINGKWVEVPGDKMLDAIQQEFAELPIVAEDLGIITTEVVALKERFKLPGMSVLQFGFSGLPDNPHSLHEQVKNSVVYSGTHDNDTTLGWFESLDEGAKNWTIEQIYQQIMPVVEELELAEEYRVMPWPLMIAAFNSVADTAIIPMQDFLQLGSEDRMNVPGIAEGNWRWQFAWQQVSEGIAPTVKALLKQTTRLNEMD